MHACMYVCMYVYVNQLAKPTFRSHSIRSWNRVKDRWTQSHLCVCECSNIFSETTEPNEANFMWNLHGIGEESLFKWSRSFVGLHCQPPGERCLLAGILP